jgi:hypothetical protein
MSATHSTFIAKPSLATRQLELLALRSFQLADRVASGELQFLDAVDVAFDSAVASGLADSVGYDAICAATIKMRGRRQSG